MSQVWYWKNIKHLMGYKWCKKKSKLPDPQNLAKTHVHLLNFTSDDLEKIYHSMQGEIWSPNGEARKLIESKKLAHTSMSVGDIVVLDNGDVMMVDLGGFVKL